MSTIRYRKRLLDQDQLTILTHEDSLVEISERRLAVAQTVMLYVGYEHPLVDDDLDQIGQALALGQLNIRDYMHFAEQIGAADPIQDQPTNPSLMLSDGRVFDVASVLQLALNETCEACERDRILTLIARHADMAKPIEVAPMPVVHHGGEEAVFVVTAAEPTKIMSVADIFKQHFRQYVRHPTAASALRAAKDECETLFAYVVRMTPGSIDVDRNRIDVLVGSDFWEGVHEYERMDPAVLVDAALIRAADWHIWKYYRDAGLTGDFVPSKETRPEREKIWRQRIVEMVADTRQKLLNNQHRADPASSPMFRPDPGDEDRRPEYFRLLRHELAGTTHLRDYEGNPILRDSKGRTPLGFPAAWADTPHARMCAVFGAFNAIADFVVALDETAFGRISQNVFHSALLLTMRRIGIAFATSYLTCIEVVAFCVVQLVIMHVDYKRDQRVVVLSDNACHPDDVRRVYARIVYWLTHLLSIYDEPGHPHIHMLHSQTLWPTDSIPPAAVRWEGAKSCRFLCRAFMHAIRRNAVADFCRDLIVQLQNL